jgi:hypothetical protein
MSYISYDSGYIIYIYTAAGRANVIEDLFLIPAVSVLLIFASLPDCNQNQTAVSDTLRLLSDF